MYEPTMTPLDLSNVVMLPGLVVETTSRADKLSGGYRSYEVFRSPSTKTVYFTFRMQFSTDENGTANRMIAKGGSILTLGTIEEMVRNSSFRMVTQPAMDKLMRVVQSQMLTPEYAECVIDHWHCDNRPLAKALNLYWESARNETASSNAATLIPYQREFRPSVIRVTHF